jgi:hypothetical protein
MNTIRVFISIALLASFAFAQDVSVTVYNQNLGLVKEIREVELEKGEFTLEAADVAAQIDPTSVHLKLDGATVLDQNFEYDLVSRERLIEKYIDQTIQVFTEQGELFEGTLLSASGTTLILQAKSGEVQVIAPEAVRDVRLGELPKGLRTRPTLVWSLTGKKSGQGRAELSYLTQGMTWHAEYVAVTEEQSNDIELSSWVSIENRSGATYKDAKLKLMAGDIHLVPKAVPLDGRAKIAMYAEAQAAPPSFEEKAFFEYHLYTLQRPATLKDRQTKQISLFEPTTVAGKKEYIYDGQRNRENVSVNLVFENSKSDGLGLPLPAGKVRVYQQDDDGSLEFVGEDRIEHTPVDEEVRLVVGTAFDLKGERDLVETKRLADRLREEAYQIKLRNHKDKSVTIIVLERIYGDWEMVQNSHKYEKKSAYTIEFEVPVEPGKEVIIAYRVRRK